MPSSLYHARMEASRVKREEEERKLIKEILIEYLRSDEGRAWIKEIRDEK